MAKTFQLSEFRTEVRNRGEYRSPYISDTELNNYINASISHLYDILVDQDPSRYLTQSNISVVSGTESYALPATFYKAVSVNIPHSSSPTGFVLARRINWQERHSFITNVPSSKESTFYAIRGGSIYFWPIPTWTDTVQLEHIPAYTTLALDADTFDGVNGWEEWIISDVLVKCAAKADDNGAVWERQRANVENRIRAAGDIDQARPKTVSNVNIYGGYLGYLRYRLRD